MTVSELVEPAYRTGPEFVDTVGPDVAEVARMADYAPDPEQRMLLDAIFAVDGRGKSAAFEAAVIACRQNLKTGLFKQCVLGWLFYTDEPLVVWSAHEFKTVQEDFKDLQKLVTGSDVLRKRVKAVRRTTGDESIELIAGPRIVFRTRTKGGGRGLSGNKVILDEGFALKPEHMGSLLPLLSAQPDPQVVYGSSAGQGTSAVLRGVRDRGRVGDPRLAYYEWSAPDPSQACRDGASCAHTLDSDGCGCDDEELWQRANPAMGRRISRENIAAERRALPPAEFGRERMGWWDDPLDGVSPISTQVWADQADPDSRVEDPVALAVDVTPDRSRTSIAAVGRRNDGRFHGELIEHQSGTAWEEDQRFITVCDRLEELAQRWGPCSLTLDPAAPVGAFVTELRDRGFVESPDPGQWQLQLVTVREYVQACGAITDDVTNDQWRHPDQNPLNQAVAGARTRGLSDAWGWSRRDSGVDISPLVAVTLARHGHATFAPSWGGGDYFMSWSA